MASVDTILDDIAVSIEAITPTTQKHRADVFKRVRTDKQLISGSDRHFKLWADALTHSPFTNCDWREFDLECVVVYSGTEEASDKVAQDQDSLETLLLTLSNTVAGVEIVDPDTFELFTDYDAETGSPLLTVRARVTFDKGA